MVPEIGGAPLRSRMVPLIDSNRLKLSSQRNPTVGTTEIFGGCNGKRAFSRLSPPLLNNVMRKEF